VTGFGRGSIAGTALASDAAGVTPRVTVRSGGARRGRAPVTGALSITVGATRSIPLWSRR
jgi:hypothetical protein